MSFIKKLFSNNNNLELAYQRYRTIQDIYDNEYELWFNLLKIGDAVYNYDKKLKKNNLRTGIILEIYNENRNNRYVIVDNLITKRQNKWHDYMLVKPESLQKMDEYRIELFDEYVDIENQNRPVEKDSVDKAEAAKNYEIIVKAADKLLESEDIRKGKCAGIYGIFSANTGECIYIGKSLSSIMRRWREHRNSFKKGKPIHRQPLLTKYMYFFKDQLELRVLLPIDTAKTSNDMIEYCERRLFEKYKPIANTIIPNGTYFGRSVLEGEDDSVSISEWNPHMVEIRVKNGQFNGFSDDKDHFTAPKA